MDVIKGEFEKGDDSDPWVKWKQGGIIGGAALAGGVVLTVIGGVVAPTISQGFGAVLQHWEVCNLPLVQNVVKEEPEVKLEDNLLLDANNGGTAFLSKAMAEEEKKLLEARVKEEEILANEAGHLNEIQFFKV
ncbi:hypothetical protein BVRB_2g045460 [Beta vulgaris subsp. vulgaris]|uniref:Uncharacterized protein n=1 Tax=Beta vulgaris subsp. vulgaris TaxID=3555 RepID=A0A0J8BER0_BETVV|nr:hypothetical protein BVRB_2g045460 [Beta vulgaris subsp. vulgaris]